MQKLWGVQRFRLYKGELHMTVQGKEVKIIKPKTGDKDELLRVGAYCRVSTDSDDQLNSFFAQVQHYN